MLKIAERIAQELAVAPRQVTAAIQLLDEGSTVPFISRYRKEVTGGLDDTQLRGLEERLGYLRELEERRTAVLKTIEEQGKLTPSLAAALQEADTKTRLEDLYLPFKQKRRTKGHIAIEAGIQPLADALLANPQLDPNLEAQKYFNTAEEFKEAFVDTKGVLEGAKYILMERFAEDPELVGELRTYLQSEAKLKSGVVKGKEAEGAKFRDYFDNADALKTAPSHRVLAMLRGRNEGILQLSIDVDKPDEALLHPCEVLTAKRLGIQNKQRPADAFLAEVVHWTWKVKLHTKLETDLLSDLRQAAETEAIRVFAHNLKDLLLAAPAGQRATLGLDPGLRTGVKVAVIDSTGQFIDHTTIYPHAPRNQWEESIATLAKLVAKYQLELVAIGNGTASRETDKLVAELLKKHPELNLQKVVVSEAGASVYSASETAAKEFPDLDVTIRGAVSIARRLQDPLAELVKIEPKSIGVGQYQHDVSQVQLAKNLDAVVEDCVNSVGVEVNTASAALLRRVAGLNQTIADNIVEFRNKNGRFTSRENLLNVPRLGAKTFEQAAGFLRIHGGENPLDSSAVHPEAYSVVEAIAAKTKTNLQSLIGNSPLIKSLNPVDFTSEKFGLPTITDILAELDKPGRDPRPAFKTASFKEGVESLTDLKVDMLLEGTVTNVTNFGAFVDIGVHQDGLVHISMLANHFVKDPHSVVKAGDIVKVKVLEVDQERKRIALSMRLGESTASPQTKRIAQPQATQKTNSKVEIANKPVRPPQTVPTGNSAFAAAFAKAQERK
ncbi:Tex family protein [uncultured Thiothrix sp.]|uniref:Tex family protein n=1 Tax=uncultured Thiothrix sp. TaxID=223185 RepID=UPI0026018821|nr:Tex family protein [uncultured Thiothrix sp.]